MRRLGRRLAFLTAAVMVPPVVKGFAIVAGAGLAVGGCVVAEQVRASLVRMAMRG